GTVTYDRAQKVSDTVRAEVKAAPGSVTAPYLTTATTDDARYAQGGDQFAIWAGGQDLSGWKDEKGVIYLDDAAGEKATVQAQLVSQDSASPFGKAGIALANDLTAPGKGGYAVLVMTEQYGLE
ncbi:glycoside hydrolase, partial [Streptomyces sp. MCAF7]